METFISKEDAKVTMISIVQYMIYQYLHNASYFIEKSAKWVSYLEESVTLQTLGGGGEESPQYIQAY